MIDARRKRSSFAFGLAAIGVVGGTYAFVAGCGSGQEAPPATPGQSQAQAETAGPGGHRHHVPPPAAFDACKAKAAGDACTVEIHDNEISGKCSPPPPGATQTDLACRPEGGPRRKGGGGGVRPEIVFAACDGKASGDACTVTFERGTVQGSCMAPKHDAGAERLLCAAAHRHGQGPGSAGEGK